MTTPEITFIRKIKCEGNKPYDQYQFRARFNEEHSIYFKTFSDVSGFLFDRFESAFDLVAVGIAIIEQNEFIKTEIKKHD